MTYQVSPEVARLIENKMSSGKYGSTDELLLDALQLLEEEENELSAIQEGLDSLDRGEKGISLDEAFSKLRKQHKVAG
jgi:putative addiction module CopG family antidote